VGNWPGMTHQVADSTSLPRSGWSFQSALYDPTVRGIFFQVLTIVLLVALIWSIAHNTAVNLARLTALRIFSACGLLKASELSK